MQIQTQTQILPVGTIQATNAVADVASSGRDPLSFAKATGSESEMSRSLRESIKPQVDVEATVSERDVRDALNKIEKTIPEISQKLEFSIDKDTDSFVVKVVDKETRDVIRQIPSEELLNIAKALDKLQGLLIKDQA